ncbi:hypothetical protein J5N97_017188 [Dioscorea zingiberensis]|uniref:Uncharacterized protein n=1 Tax=Dioscorea zingiberensis TaxID=325984 RepID=A0A9D5CKS2_9LILI|nr:hypothetical protein J5N97_017188 [Dioscorea zingiberensis]
MVVSAISQAWRWDNIPSSPSQPGPWSPPPCTSFHLDILPYATPPIQYHEGFSFTEIAFSRASTSKVVCYHFSSDGKLLATGGHDKRIAFIVAVFEQDTKEAQL